MYIGKTLTWFFIAYMVYKPIGIIHLWVVSMTPPMSVIALVFSTIAYWTIAIVSWLSMPVVLPYIYRILREKKAKQLALREKDAIRKMELVAQARQEEQKILDAPLIPITPAQTLLKSKETAYAAALADLHQEKTVGYTAGSRGTSIRIAKGLSFKIKGTRQQAIKGLVTISSGELVVTNERLIFSGTPKSFVLSLNSLISVTLYQDGLTVSDGKATHTLIFQNAKELKMFGITLNKALSAK